MQNKLLKNKNGSSIPVISTQFMNNQFSESIKSEFDTLLSQTIEHVKENKDKEEQNIIASHQNTKNNNTTSLSKQSLVMSA